MYFNPWELKKELEKDIKGVYLLTINDDGGVMVLLDSGWDCALRARDFPTRSNSKVHNGGKV